MSDVLVTDALPVPDFDSVVWSCTPSAATNTFCTTFNADTAANTALSLSTTIPTLGTGESVVFTATAKLGTVDGSKASLPNTATVKSTNTAVPWDCADPLVAGACQSSASINLSSTPKLSIVKVATGGVGPYFSNQDVTYTITVKNHGPVAVSEMMVSDTLPANFTSATWTCAPSGAAACPTFSASGLVLSTTNLALGVNESVTFTAVAKLGTVTANLTGLANTATVGTTTKSGKLAKVATSTFACVGTDGTTPMTMPCQSTALINLSAAPVLSLTKKINQETGVGNTTDLEYTITVTNAGDVDLPNVVINDTQPAEVTFQSWTCTGTGVACPALGAVGPQLTQTVPLLPKGASLVYTIKARLVQTTAVNTTFTNTVTATSSLALTQCKENAQAVPCTASAPATTAGMLNEGLAVPVDKPWMLALMSLALIGMAGVAQRRRAQRAAQGKR